MDDETENDRDPNRQPIPERPSLIPSWVMLGFVIGALFVWLLPRQDSPNTGSAKDSPSKQASAGKLASTSVSQKKAPPRRLTDVEAVFAAYGSYAVWDQNRTEIALWNAEKEAYSEFYEVLRDGEILYFRSIPKLTRPLLAHGTKTDLPLLYTETEEMRQRWIEARNQLVPAIPKSSDKAPSNGQ